MDRTHCHVIFFLLNDRISSHLFDCTIGLTDFLHLSSSLLSFHGLECYSPPKDRPSTDTLDSESGFTLCMFFCYLFIMERKCSLWLSETNRLTVLAAVAGVFETNLYFIPTALLGATLIFYVFALIRKQPLDRSCVSDGVGTAAMVVGLGV